MEMETKYINEFGTDIPAHIAKKAKEMGCYNLHIFTKIRNG